MEAAKSRLSLLTSWWKDKTIAVTGGANGIGRAIVYQVAALGAIPIILDNDIEALEKVDRELSAHNSKHMCIPIDLRLEDQCKIAINCILSEYASVTVLVNNVGVNDKVSLFESPLEQFRESFELNLVSTYNITRHLAPYLESNIVNILSKVYLTGQGGTSGYAASKGALAGLTREWAVDFLPRGIRVNGIIPAEVLTDGYGRWLSTFPDQDEKLESITKRIPLGERMTLPEEIADAVIFLASPAASHITGELLKVDGGYCNLDRAL